MIEPEGVLVPRESTLRHREFLEGKTGTAWLEGWREMVSAQARDYADDRKLIEAQQAIQKSEMQAQRAAAEIADLRRKLEEARKALEPFAAAKGHFDGHVRDEDTVDIALRHIRAHHVRAAARALSGASE